MRRLFHFLGLALVTAAPLSAQRHLEALGGAASSSVHFSNGENSGIRSRTGLALGIGMRRESDHRFRFAPDLLVTARGAVFPNGGDRLTASMTMLEFQPLFRVNLSSESSLHPFAFGGGTLGFMLSCKTTIEYNQTNDKGKCDEVLAFNGMQLFKSTDFGLVIGFGFHPINRLSVTARYSHGLRDINGLGTNYLDSKINSRAMMLLGGYAF